MLTIHFYKIYKVPILTLTFFLILFLGCTSNAPENHNRKLQGIYHKNDITNPLKYCTVCHGSSLQGSSSYSSCYKCHSNLWTMVKTEDASSHAPSTHTNSLGGINHNTGYLLPTSNCTSCHGSDLSGGDNNQPSCYLCHFNEWSSVSHSTSLGGYLHAANYSSPTENCIICHGSDLRGGDDGEPSCYKCHGNEWNEGDDDD
ncbi:MAG: hypothetical protein ABIA04_13155 [Pseudomonadota bacterium]